MTPAQRAALDVAIEDLDAAAQPTKSEVFTACGVHAADLRDAIKAVLALSEAPAPVEPRPDREAIERVIDDADRRLAYSMNLVRLVDGDRTYRLQIDGQSLTFTDSDTPEWNAQERLYAHVAECKSRIRADAIPSLFTAPASASPALSAPTGDGQEDQISSRITGNHQCADAGPCPHSQRATGGDLWRIMMALTSGDPDYRVTRALETISAISKRFADDDPLSLRFERMESPDGGEAVHEQVSHPIREELSAPALLAKKGGEA